MSIKLASHLYRNRHGTFYFRLVVPVRLRQTAGRREFRFSLGTECRSEATRAALSVIAGVPELYAGLESMTEEDRQNSADYFKMWALAERKGQRLTQQVEELERELAEANAKLAGAVSRSSAVMVAKLLKRDGILEGKRELEQSLVFPWPANRTEPYSVLQAAYMVSLKSRPSGKALTPKSIEDYDHTLREFITVMGDLRIGAIDRELVQRYFTTLRRLPANLSRLTQYERKTIEQILELNAPPQSEGTASKKLGRIATMFKWALGEKSKWGIDTNPFTGFGQKASKGSTRRPFNVDELTLIFRHPSYASRHFSSSYAFWMIPLAIFTGARQTELTQLDLKDFIEVDGIACIDINEDDARLIKEGQSIRKKRLKTPSAKRLVPIHAELIRMGLLRHVDKLRAAGEQHLFPELNRDQRDGPGRAVSSWFQRYRKKVGITEKQATVFHSFRHLFITTVMDSGKVTEHALAAVVGHEAGMITGKVYWDQRDAKKRLPTVQAFELPDDVRGLIPALEDVVLPPERHPSRVCKRGKAS